VDIKGVISTKSFYLRKEQGNKYLTSTMDSDNLHERLQGLTDSGDYFIVLPGSLGTAMELMLVWNLYYINNHFPAKKDPVKKIFAFRGLLSKYMDCLTFEKIHGKRFASLFQRS